ncbi:hypothetical protein SH528x_003179 [Novipirellula sp. SH528]|uniref:hypothetical protein n=1 Tax=Novipirellula sp. SH528 TaxID=3454466 RepID=UPI003F9FF126
MTSAHLVCHDCQLTLHLGTIKHAADENRIGFSHGKYSPSELAALIEAFIAVHLEHNVETNAEQDFDTQDWSRYTALRPMPTVPAEFAPVDTMTVGPIVVRIEPHDGPSNDL